MGLIFTKDKKEKIINKIYNSFYEKENLITKIKFDDLECDAIIVTKKGIFIFEIITNSYSLDKYQLNDELWIIDEKKSIKNPLIKLNLIKEKILEILNEYSLDNNIYLCPIFNKLDNDSEEIIFNLKGFKRYIEKINNVFNNDEINFYTSLIKNKSN